MSFLISYKTLFEVKILHHYHLDKGGDAASYGLFDLLTAAERDRIIAGYDFSSFLRLEPTEQCARDLQRHKCVFRRLNDRLIVAIKAEFDSVNNAFKPSVELPDDLEFNFQAFYIDPTFTNYTNLSLDAGQGQVYHFENSETERVYPSLSRTAAQRDNNLIYNDNDILVDDSNAPTLVMMAQGVTGSPDPEQTFLNDEPVNGNPLRYINKRDLISVFGDLLSFDTGVQGIAEQLTCVLEHRSGAVIPRDVSIFETANTVVQLRLNDLQEGIYKLQLSDGNAFEKEIIFFLNKSKAVPDAVITIRLKPGDPDFDLLDSNSMLRSAAEHRSFELRFKNRSTVWRYLGARFSNRPTAGPYYLTKNGFVSVSAEDKDGNTIEDLPNASVHMIKTERPESAPENYNLLSEIYFNT